MPDSKKNGHNAWTLTKEKILMYSGIAVITYEVAFAEQLGQSFHFEVLLAGLALCGVSIAQWGDKR